ncbi:MAG: hypothetical protein RLZZ514_1281 [Actinomycetota bacterium]|jgi:hypothetical protein
MKTTVRKIASVTAALAMSLGMLVATAAPASAQARPKIAYDAVTPAIINQPFDVDYSCYKDATNPNEPDTATNGTWFLENDMALPPGLTFDTNDNHIKGTPTELGSFKLPLIKCLQGGVNGFYEGIRVGTILVTPPSTPTPSLSATVLSNYKCEVRLIGVLPATPDPSTAKITATFGAESSVLTLRNYAASEIIDITLSMNNFVASAQSNPNIASVTSGPDFSCGNEVIFTLGYQNGGAPVATAQAIVTTRGVEIEPTVWVSTVLNQACTVRIQASVSQFTDDDLFRITVSAGIGGWDIQYKDVTPGNPLDTVIDFRNVPNEEEDSRIATVFVWGEPFDCQNAGIQAGTKYNGIAVDVNIISTAVVTPVCAPGSYGKVAFEGALVYRQCLPAPIGSYVDLANVLAEPTLAPKGYFVNTTSATSATKCPAGLTTELPGARSINDCYKQKFQTAKAIKTPTKLKFGAKHETAGRADAGLALDAVATGSCTVTKITKTVKINGKSVKQPRWVIKATNKAGNCKVTFSNPGDYTYKPFTVTKTIKVTKTGK